MSDRPKTDTRDNMSRRSLLAISAGASGFWALAPFPARAQSATRLLDPTPACDDGHEPTPSAVEGPYFRPNSLERRDITDARYSGREMVVGGYVFDRACRPIAGALVEIWQADPDGAYDTSGHHLRGHQFTEGDGRWLFASVKPGIYAPRSRHIHLKVQRPNGDVLTTQMFFPNDPTQAGDRLFDPRLVADIAYAQGDSGVRMDIVLPEAA